MKQAHHILNLQTHGLGLVDFTRQVTAFVAGTGIQEGLLTLFVRHTSASLTIQENADPDVQTDLVDFFKRLVPESRRDYRHICEGLDDMPAHIKTALTQVHLSIPVVDGRLVLGTWQGIYLFEHRAGAKQRQVVLQLLGL